MKATQNRKAAKNGKKAVAENIIEATAPVPAALIAEQATAEAAQAAVEGVSEAPQEQSAVAAPAGAQQPEERWLDMDSIVNSPFNPRKNFDDDKLQELATSIGKVGVLQPICVRRNGDSYQIVYGERRYWAAVKAGCTAIRAMVYESLSDEEAEDMAITENLQRVDITPIEEAAAFLRALKTGRHTVETLVDKFGKSESYIRSHLRLNELIEPLVELLDREEIIVSMAIELAKYPTEIQTQVYQEHFQRDDYNSWKNTRPKDVAKYLYEKFMTKLETYRFDKMECQSCAQNTANQVLFVELAKECAGCENRECMIRKNNEYLVQKAIQMQKDDPRILLAVQERNYTSAVLEALSEQGYTVEVINPYSMTEPDLPERYDDEMPKEEDYDDPDQYTEALETYEADLEEYQEEMKEVSRAVSEGRVRKYALIGTLDVELFYEEVPVEVEETTDENGENVYVSIAPPRPIVELESRVSANRRSLYINLTMEMKRILRAAPIPKTKIKPAENNIFNYSLLLNLPHERLEELGYVCKDPMNRIEESYAFVEKLTADQKNMLIRASIFRFINSVAEYTCTTDNALTRMICDFAELHCKDESRKAYEKQVENFEKTEAKLKEQIENLRRQELLEAAQEAAEAESEPDLPIEPETPEEPTGDPGEAPWIEEPDTEPGSVPFEPLVEPYPETELATAA